MELKLTKNGKKDQRFDVKPRQNRTKIDQRCKYEKENNKFKLKTEPNYDQLF